MSAFVAGVLMQPLHVTLGRFLPEPGREAIVPTLGRLLLLVGLASLLVATPFEGFSPTWLPPGIVLGAVALGTAQGIFDFTAQYLSSTLQTGRYSTLYFLKAAGVLSVGLLTLWLGFGIWGLVIATIASYLVSTALTAHPVWTRILKGRLDGEALVTIRAYSLPLSITVIGGFVVAWSDRLILAAWVEGNQLGAYGAAADLTLQGFVLIFHALHLAWFPRLVAVWQRAPEQFAALLSRYAQLSAALLFPAAFGFFLVSSELIHVLLGPAYQVDAARVMPWLVLSAFLGGIRTYFLDLPLHLTQRMVHQGGVVAAVAAVGIILSLLFVPRHGIVAAAISWVIAQLLGCMISGVLCLRTLRPALHTHHLGGISAGLLAIAATLHALPSGGAYMLALRILAGAVAFGLVAVAFNVAGIRSSLLNLYRSR